MTYKCREVKVYQNLFSPIVTLVSCLRYRVKNSSSDLESTANHMVFCQGLHKFQFLKSPSENPEPVFFLEGTWFSRSTKSALLFTFAPWVTSQDFSITCNFILEKLLWVICLQCLFFFFSRKTPWKKDNLFFHPCPEPIFLLFSLLKCNIQILWSQYMWWCLSGIV